MLRALLVTLGLLASRPAWPCTTFLLDQGGEAVAVGKSYDWHIGEALILTNKRGVTKRALAFRDDDRPAVWTSKRASITFNQYGRELPNGGINEAGLVVEIMWLDRSSYPPPDRRPTVNELQWIQYNLDNFSTVAEMRKNAPTMRVSPVSGRVHYLACDTTTECAAFEYVGRRLVISAGSRDLPVPVLTNHPYSVSARFLRKHATFGGDRPVPDSTGSLERFVRAASLARSSAKTPVVDRAFEILKSVEVRGYTKWQIVYEPKAGRVHYRTSARPATRSVSFDQIDPSCNTPVEMVDIDAPRSTLVPYAADANARLVKNGLRKLRLHLPRGAAAAMAAFPGTTTCSAPKL